MDRCPTPRFRFPHFVFMNTCSARGSAPSPRCSCCSADAAVAVGLPAAVDQLDARAASLGGERHAQVVAGDSGLTRQRIPIAVAARTRRCRTTRGARRRPTRPRARRPASRPSASPPPTEWVATGHHDAIPVVNTSNACSSGTATCTVLWIVEISRLGRQRSASCSFPCFASSRRCVCLCRGLVRVQGLRPEPVEVVPQVGNPARSECIDTPGTLAMLGDEPCLTKDAQMLRDCRPAHRQPRRELAHRLRARAEPLENRPPGRIAESPRTRLRKQPLT